MLDEAGFERALSLHGSRLGGRAISVKPALGRGELARLVQKKRAAPERAPRGRGKAAAGKAPARAAAAAGAKKRPAAGANGAGAARKKARA